MTSYEFLEAKIGRFNTNHPVGILRGEIPDWGDILDWMEEYAELKKEEAQ